MSDIECGDGFVYDSANSASKCAGVACNVAGVAYDKGVCCVPELGRPPPLSCHTLVLHLLLPFQRQHLPTSPGYCPGNSCASGWYHKSDGCGTDGLAIDCWNSDDIYQCCSPLGTGTATCGNKVKF